MESLIIVLQIFQIFLILLMAMIMFYVGYVMLTFKNFVPFVPTPAKVAKKIATLAKLQLGERACDLGSGSGKLILALARLYPQNEIIGYEISPLLRFVSRLKIGLSFLKNKKVKIINQDIFNVKLNDFDVIVFYLVPKAIERLMPEFSQMKVGSRLIANNFPLPSGSILWQEETIHLSDRSSLYVYTKIS